MSSTKYLAYTTAGYWTIRRSNRFWSENFTDQTIEQVLMRMLKSRGGLAHGGSVTASTQAKLVHIIPRAVPICGSLESLSGVNTGTTDQHKDIRPSSRASDGLHFKRFKDSLSQHSPFIYKGEYKDRLMCISTGFIAPPPANAEMAIELGEAAAEQLTGKTYADVKLKRNDKVTSIGATTNSAEVRGCKVEIDPISLFLPVMQKPDEMKDHLTYEFSKHQPSLFDGSLMRKTTESVLAEKLRSGVRSSRAEQIQDAFFVIDGGHLLHCVV